MFSKVFEDVIFYGAKMREEDTKSGMDKAIEGLAIGAMLVLGIAALAVPGLRELLLVPMIEMAPFSAPWQIESMVLNPSPENIALNVFFLVSNLVPIQLPKSMTGRPGVDRGGKPGLDPGVGGGGQAKPESELGKVEEGVWEAANGGGGQSKPGSGPGKEGYPVAEGGGKDEAKRLDEIYKCASNQYDQNVEFMAKNVEAKWGKGLSEAMGLNKPDDKLRLMGRKFGTGKACKAKGT
jgi:hypothetical protein